MSELSFNPSLSQYMTPSWAAHALWETMFPNATPKDIVVEPTCGDGRMLDAVPKEIPAFGCEIDPDLAAVAKIRTQRPVFVGDFFDYEIPLGTTIAWGNPPFKAEFMDRMLQKFSDAMGDGGQCGFICPSYFLQTPSRIIRWNRTWTISCELLPRTIWPRLMRPICFARFTKDPAPRLVGLRCYFESDAVSSTGQHAYKELVHGSGRWVDAVEATMRSLGGRAHLSQLYEAMLARRPTSNTWWKEKIRQVLQKYNNLFRNVGTGVWEVTTQTQTHNPTKAEPDLPFCLVMQ